jgi:hypothetical protein
MTNNTNAFGGKNPHGMYVPMTDDEMEVLERIADAGRFELVVNGHGTFKNFSRKKFVAEQWKGDPIVVFGDKRITFYFVMNFTAPEIPQKNWYFDCEVHALGRLMTKHRLPTEINGKPIQIVAGQTLALALDVAIDSISPDFIRVVKPKTIGLTTRHGNMILDPHTRKLLRHIQEGERKVRELTLQDAKEATDKQHKKT